MEMSNNPQPQPSVPQQNMPQSPMNSDAGTHNTGIIIGVVVILLILVGVYAWYQYTRRTTIPAPMMTPVIEDKALNSLEAELNAEETQNLDLEMGDIEKEIAK